MAISLENVREAVVDFISQGKDLMAKQRAANAISGAMVSAWLESHGYGQASPATVAKHINTLKNEAITGERAEARQSPLDPTTTGRMNDILMAASSSITALLLETRQKAMDEATTQEEVYSTDEAQLQETAAVQLADALAKIKELEEALDDAKTEAAKAQGTIESLEGQLAQARASIDTATAKVRDELTTEFGETRKAMEVRIDQLTRENGRIPDLTGQIETLTASIKKAEAERAKATNDFVELTRSAEAQSKAQHKDIVRLTNERGEQVQARVSAETALAAKERELTNAQETLATTQDELATVKNELKEAKEKAQKDIAKAESLRDKAINEREHLNADLAKLQGEMADLQKRYEANAILLAERTDKLNTAAPTPKPKAKKKPKSTDETML